MIKKNLMMKHLWFTPEVYYKKGAISCLKYLEQSQILILIAPPVKNSDYFSKIEKFLKEKNTSYEEITNPDYEKINDLIETYKNSKPEVIIAIGGGSVIDSAKVLRTLLNYPDINFENLADAPFLVDNAIKLIAIPTTPSTGSETTPVAVLYDKERNKHPFVNKGFIPDMAVLDVNFLTSLKEQYIFQFAADIFAHATEGSVSALKTPLIKSLGDSGLKLLEEGIKMFKENPKDLKGLSKIQYAGYLAGIVQGNAFVGACHALAHSMEKQIKVSHGESVLLVLKPTLEWLGSTTQKPEYKTYLNLYDRLGLEKYRNYSLLKSLDSEKWIQDALLDPSITTAPIRFKIENLRELVSWILNQK